MSLGASVADSHQERHVLPLRLVDNLRVERVNLQDYLDDQGLKHSKLTSWLTPIVWQYTGFAMRMPMFADCCMIMFTYWLQRTQFWIVERLLASLQEIYKRT